MHCKHHPGRRAEHYCKSCGIPICNECSEEARPGEFYCFQCAMLTSLSEGGTRIKDQRERFEEKKEEGKGKKKWTPFRYFFVVSSVLILVMWGVILFGGQKAPSGRMDLAFQPRVLLFLADSAIKRYAHYEGTQYPSQLADLFPKYLSISKGDLVHLDLLSYMKDQQVGYRLSLKKPTPGEMNLIITSKGITYGPS